MSILFSILSLIALGVVAFVLRYSVELAGPVVIGVVLMLWGIGSFIFPFTMPFIFLQLWHPWAAIIVVVMGAAGVVRGLLSKKVEPPSGGTFVPGA